MNNIQLAIILELILDKLTDGIDHADMSLPKDIPRMDKRVYTGSSPMPALDFANWKIEQCGRPKALSKLDELEETISRHIEVLHKTD